jgi:chaperonin GroES
MIELDSYLKITKELTEESDLCHYFSEEDLARIGAIVKEGFEQDLESRSTWEKRYQAGLDLALQLVKEKTFPWPGASNVKFPLVTIAALQWHSRAYPILINGPEIVKLRVRGDDPQGEKAKRAKRVGDYMSWQLLEEDEAWEEETDRGLIQLPIVGSIFKKTRRDSVRKMNTSSLVSPRDFVLNYWATSVETCPRKTHVIPLHRNDLVEKMRLGQFKDWENSDDSSWLAQIPVRDSRSTTTREDKRTGQTATSRGDEQTPFETLEQHVLLDLDHDGYAEPYIITVERTSGRMLRIVCGFEWSGVRSIAERGKDKIITIAQLQYFTQYTFIPSPDGGIYGMGFGAFLGPLNSAVDSIINQLIDAGTLATTSGGFLGKGIRIRGGEYSFRPFGWQRVDSTGEDLAKGVFPFPVREPSNVLFQLLGLLIDYTNRISGSTDIMVGENPGQNTPAQTSQLMAEQGAKINSAIFKRVWRGMKKEFKKLYDLNKIFVPLKGLTFGEGNQGISADDFTASSDDIRPAADPNLTSSTMKMQQATMVVQRAYTVPGYNKELAERRFLMAHQIEDIDAIYPGPDKIPAPENLKVTLENMKTQREQGKLKQRMQEKLLEFASKREETQANIELIKAQVAQIVAEIGAGQATHELKVWEAQLATAQAYDEHLKTSMELFKGIQDGDAGNGAGGAAGAGGVQPMAGASGNPGGNGGSAAPGG